MSGFGSGQIAALGAPLAREAVKSRAQAGRQVPYIEGWHVIAEANRIFGFDGWKRETVMSECCYAGDYEKAIYENGHKTDRTITSFRCSYRARVRVTVGEIVREGSGHGHGFSDNPGEAHESAEKEAETDAMKRAMMTFGNPFGLALYDKKQEGVEDTPRTANAGRPNGSTPAPAAAPAAQSRPQNAAPPANAPPRSAPTPVEHPKRQEALDAFNRVRRVLAAQRLPKQIDDVITAETRHGTLALIKEVHEPSYADLLQFAQACKGELLSAA